MITVSSYSFHFTVEEMENKTTNFSKVIKTLWKWNLNRGRLTLESVFSPIIVLLILKKYAYDCYQISQCHILKIEGQH